jgi:hypothetical protein
MVTAGEMRASRWLAVHVEVVEHLTGWKLRRRKISGVVWAMVLNSPNATLDLESNVVLTRKDNGAALIEYHYLSETSARHHERSLNARLGELSLYEMCDALGIAFELIERAEPVD